jgi:predicted RNA-binding protein associated with RNAse of E/G family
MQHPTLNLELSTSVRIRYRRLPDHTHVFEQRLVERSADCVVTLLESTPEREPLRMGKRTVLETGSPIVWFTFPGAWHDIGRFHRADGRFTGFYANILTPVAAIESADWETTDLFLDVWLDTLGSVSVLDVEELNQAATSGWLDQRTVARARTEAAALVRLVGLGQWPPPVVWEWTLERARAAQPSR